MFKPFQTSNGQVSGQFWALLARGSISVALVMMLIPPAESAPAPCARTVSICSLQPRRSVTAASTAQLYTDLVKWYASDSSDDGGYLVKMLDSGRFISLRSGMQIRLVDVHDGIVEALIVKDLRRPDLDSLHQTGRALAGRKVWFEEKRLDLFRAN
jgi:hypothetical protein